MTNYHIYYFIQFYYTYIGIIINHNNTSLIQYILIFENISSKMFHLEYFSVKHKIMKQIWKWYITITFALYLKEVICTKEQFWLYFWTNQLSLIIFCHVENEIDDKIDYYVEKIMIKWYHITFEKESYVDKNLRIMQDKWMRK